MSDWHTKKKIRKRGGWAMKTKALLTKLERSKGGQQVQRDQ